MTQRRMTAKQRKAQQEQEQQLREHPLMLQHDAEVDAWYAQRPLPPFDETPFAHWKTLRNQARQAVGMEAEDAR